MTDRRVRYPLLWLGFLVCMLVGAGLLLSDSSALQWTGIALLLLPLLLLGVLTAVYYLLERSRAKPKP